jgi:hypothetical protein
MRHKQNYLIALAALALIVFYHMIFRQFFPNMHGKMGHDYALFLPKLLDGYFWFSMNGIFSIPWFTPAFCGGIPLFPDPQSIYYSVPQFLSFVFDPVTSVHMTVMLFAVLGFLGFYILLQRVFQTGAWLALLGGGLFLFNGFYIHRMLIGHLTYHPFMLVPLLAFFLLRSGAATQSQGAKGVMLDGVMAGIVLAYMFQAGMVNVTLPAVGSVIIIGLMYEAIHNKTVRFGLRLICAGGIAVAFCSAKLVAAMAYLHYFGRDMYKLPGTQTLAEAALIALHSLFIAPAFALAHEMLVNVQWGLDRHEFEFGVTFVPLVWLFGGSMAMIPRARKHGLPCHSLRQQWFRIALIGGLLFLPICLNYYTPTWNAILKHLPILKNSTSLIRWMSLYIPVVIVLTALAGAVLLRSPTFHPYAVVASLATVVLLNIWTDRQFYHDQSYDPRQIVTAYNEVQLQGRSPGITHIVMYADQTGRGIMPQGRNDVLVQGGSQLLCYEPLFGYALEKFPIRTLRPDSVFAVREEYLNLKNPVCYVYPLENACEPGEHFLVDQQEVAKAFSTYKPIPFRLPAWQKAANVFNLLTLVGSGGVLLVAGAASCRRWWKSHRAST